MTQNPIVLKELTPPIKVLFTGYLCTVGIGYMFALIQILFTHGMADGKFGLSVDDIVYSYYGNRSGTVLEQKLNGSMKDNAPEQERFKLMEWVRSGADANEYKEDGIEKIIQTRCVMCHNKEAADLPDFTSLKGLSAYTAQDTGATFASLTRVSHVHMFGISFIFMFVGLIFSFSETTTNQCLSGGGHSVMVAHQNSSHVCLVGYFSRHGYGGFVYIYVGDFAIRNVAVYTCFH